MKNEICEVSQVRGSERGNLGFNVGYLAERTPSYTMEYSTGGIVGVRQEKDYHPTSIKAETNDGY